MRHLLTGLAIILIVALTAALAGPYLVDWNAQRGFLEARLTQALGQKVTIGGSIDLKLLPTPYLVLDQTVIGEDDGPIKTGIRHLDLELSIAPLLHGEFDITEARLEEPTVRVTLQRDRTLPALPPAPAFEADVRFDRITLVDGTLAIADPLSGHTFVADHLDMIAEAPSLSGPYKASGTTGEGAALTKFRLSTTTAQNGKTRARLVVDETPLHPGLDLDGVVALADAAPDAVRQTFAGTASLSGHVWITGAAPLAWKLSGPLEADPQHARLDKGELRIGGEEAGLSLQARAEGAFGAAPALHLDLTGKQIDIDRLSGAPVDAVKPAPPRLPTLARLRAALAAVTPPVPSSLDVAIEAATYGGEPLNDLRAHLGSGATPVLQVSGEGPGGLHLALDGRLAQEGFDGAVDAGVDALPRAIPWLATVDPDLIPRPNGTPFRDLPFKSLRFVGKIKTDGYTLASQDFALTFDRSVLTGTGRVSLETVPMAVEATLAAKALDLDALPALSALDATMGGIDLDLALDAKAVRIAEVGDSALAAGHLSLTLTKTGRAVALTRFHAENLGGATLEATGSLLTDGATFAAKVDAAHLDAAAALVGRLAPGDFAQALIARAGSLAPARLAIDATLARAKGGLTPTRLAIKGQLASTTIDASLAPDQGGGVALAASLDAPEGSALLRQLGFPALPIDTIGKSHVALAASGRSGRPLDTRLHASFGASRVDVAGAYDLLGVGGTRLAGSGTATLRSPDLGPLLQSLAIAFPEMTGRLPASGTAGLALGQAGVALSSLDGKLGDVALKGALQWKAAGQPALTGALDVDRLDAATLFGLALGPAQPSGADGSWSKEAFAAGLIDPPRGDLALTAKTFVLRDGLVAHDARLDLAIAPNLVTIKRFEASLAGGHVGGDLALRRDGRQASLEGKIMVKDAAIDLPGVKAGLGATLDLAGGGTSAATLIASLAGAGTAKATRIAVPGADPAALPKIFEAVEADTLAVDEDSIVRAFDETAKTPLEAGDRGFDLGLAAGILRLKDVSAPEAKQADVSSTLDVTLDLRRISLDVRAEETLRALPKGWTGPPPSIVAIQAGPPMAPKRSFEVSGFINAVATRALARESARIEAYEFDIRERAFFNQRLASERRREEDRVRAEDDARKVEAEHKAEAERKARIEAARLEKARRDEMAKAAREKDEQDRLSRDQRDRQADPASASPATGAGSAPPASSDPSAAGRY